MHRRLRSLSLVCCLFVPVATLGITVGASTAEAIPCLPPTWYASAPADPVVALEGGALVVPASIQSTFDEIDPARNLDSITQTVARVDGSEPVSGSLSWDEFLSAVIWRPDAPLPADGSTWRATFVFDSSRLGGSCGFGGGGQTTVVFDFTVSDMSPTTQAPEASLARLTETRESVGDCCTTSAPELCYPDPWPCQTCWAVDYTYAPTLVVTWTAMQGADLEPWVAYRVDRVEADGTVSEVRTSRHADGSEVPVVFELGDPGPFCARVTALDRRDETEVASQEVCAELDALEPIQRDTPPDPPTDRCDGPGDDTTADGDDTSPGDTTPGDGSTADDATAVDTDEGCSCRVRAAGSPAHGGLPPWSLALGLLAGLALWRRQRRHG